MKEWLALFVRLNGFIGPTKVVSTSHRHRRRRRRRAFQCIACRASQLAPAPRKQCNWGNNFINVSNRYAVG